MCHPVLADMTVCYLVVGKALVHIEACYPMLGRAERFVSKMLASKSHLLLMARISPWRRPVKDGTALANTGPLLLTKTINVVLSPSGSRNFREGIGSLATVGYSVTFNQDVVGSNPTRLTIVDER